MGRLIVRMFLLFLHVAIRITTLENMPKEGDNIRTMNDNSRLGRNEKNGQSGSNE
jgi:hypothetical protein